MSETHGIDDLDGDTFFDKELWLKVVGGEKKGRVYGQSPGVSSSKGSSFSVNSAEDSEALEARIREKLREEIDEKMKKQLEEKLEEQKRAFELKIKEQDVQMKKQQLQVAALMRKLGIELPESPEHP